MGLFSNVIHCWQAERESVIEALDAALADAALSRRSRRPVSAGGPMQDLESRIRGEEPIYFVCRRAGDWLSVIEGDCVGSAPDTASLARRMSELIDGFVLSLIVHDDDLMFYNLFSKGTELDGYNSCPQYFENDRLSEEYIESQRHTPDELAPVLPAGVTAAEVALLLNRGWWNAYDSGRLDEDGVEPEESDGFAFEGERMIAFGDLLELHGETTAYPFAGWLDDPNVKWDDYEVLVYAPAGYLNAEPDVDPHRQGPS